MCRRHNGSEPSVSTLPRYHPPVAAAEDDDRYSVCEDRQRRVCVNECDRYRCLIACVCVFAEANWQPGCPGV